MSCYEIEIKSLKAEVHLNRPEVIKVIKTVKIIYKGKIIAFKWNDVREASES